jgi:hypothetical protein
MHRLKSKLGTKTTPRHVDHLVAGSRRHHCGFTVSTPRMPQRTLAGDDARNVSSSDSPNLNFAYQPMPRSNTSVYDASNISIRVYRKPGIKVALSQRR